MNFTARILVIAVAATVFFVGVSYPEHNWDMIGYVASAHYQDGLRGERLLTRTYADVNDEVGAELFETLSKGDDYRREVYQSAVGLEEQIPLYSARLVYVDMIRGLGAVGVSYPRASYYVSAFFSALSVLVLGVICLRAQLSVPLLPLVVLAAGYLQLARLSTPDSLAVFGSLLATLACMSGSAWVYVLAAVLPALRTEYIIFSVLLMLAMLCRGQRLRALGALAASLVVYLAVGVSQHTYGWLTLLHLSFVKRTAFPSKVVPPHDVMDYLAAYRLAVWELIGSPHFIVYLVSGYLLAVFGRALWTRDLYSLELFAIPIAFVVFHLALFPSYQDRFFVLPASLILIWILGSIRSISARHADAQI